MIELSHVSKLFGTRPAVSDLCLLVKRGDIFGLLGHNGAGKSTTIGMLLGQVWPGGGEIRVCGHDITTQRGRALGRVGAIFETPVFYDYLSGWQNLEVLSQYTAPTPAERIRKIVEWVGLTGREHDKVRKYSHGMRTRLALAQALLPEPELLILDEPSDGLDPEGIHEMRHTILRLHRELGLTIFLSSHLLHEVQQLCSRVAVLNQGKKVFDGTLADIRRPGNWVRLEVSEFDRAFASLQAAGLAQETREGKLVSLRPDIANSTAVRHLVEAGFDVNEIVRDEQTLEDFYLGLMNPNHQAKPTAASPA